MLPWILIGWPILTAFGLVAWSCRQPADALTQAAEDAEQAASLAAWRAAHVAKQNADLRRDTRAKHVTEEALKTAMNLRLKVGS